MYFSEVFFTAKLQIKKKDHLFKIKLFSYLYLYLLHLTKKITYPIILIMTKGILFLELEELRFL